MNQIIRFRVTDEDKQTIEAEAQKLGLTVSSFIRFLIKNWNNGFKVKVNNENKS